MLRVVKSPFELLELWQIVVLLLLLLLSGNTRRTCALLTLYPFFFLNRQFGPALRTIVVRSFYVLSCFPVSHSHCLVFGIKISLSLRHCAWIYATVFLLFLDTLAEGILVIA